jgi:hypothetical protein
MTISEPTTMLTDYLLTLVCLLVGFRLFRALDGHSSRWLWGMGFIMMGIGALIGGSYHGYALLMDEGTHRSFWNLTLIFLGLGAGFMLSGTYVASFSRWSWTARWLYLGLAVSVAGLTVQLSGISLHQHLNHNDIYHLIQLAGLYCFYKGARLMRD